MTVTVESSFDALSDWSGEVAPYEDLIDALTLARGQGTISGLKLQVCGGGPTDNAVGQRSTLADAIMRHLESAGGSHAHLKVLLFDRFWRANTAVNRRLGGDRIVERGRLAHGLTGKTLSVDALTLEDQIRWAALLDLHHADLPGALAATEREDGAILIGSSRSLKATSLMQDLFADEQGNLATRALWPLWIMRRREAGDGVVLAGELNDHSGRHAFLFL